MIEGNNHQMAAGVGVSIQNDEGAFPPEGDQILHPVLALQRITKDAATFVLVVHNIVHSPGRPDVIHSSEYSNIFDSLSLRG